MNDSNLSVNVRSLFTKYSSEMVADVNACNHQYRNSWSELLLAARLKNYCHRLVNSGRSISSWILLQDFQKDLRSANILIRI